MNNREIGPEYSNGPEMSDEDKEEIAGAAVNVGMRIVEATTALRKGVVIGVDITDENGETRQFSVEVTEIFTEH